MNDSLCVCVHVLRVSACSVFLTPWTVAHDASLSRRFPRQEYWSRLPFPPPGDLPNPGIEPRSPTLWADALTSEPPGLVIHSVYMSIPIYQFIPLPFPLWYQ